MSLGTFPVPAAAKVAENISGYTVTTNTMLQKGGDTGAFIVFTGHGYKGTVDSLNQFPGTSVQGVGDTNVTTIIFAPTK